MQSRIPRTRLRTVLVTTSSFDFTSCLHVSWDGRGLLTLQIDRCDPKGTMNSTGAACTLARLRWSVTAQLQTHTWLRCAQMSTSPLRRVALARRRLLALFLLAYFSQPNSTRSLVQTVVLARCCNYGSQGLNVLARNKCNGNPGKHWLLYRTHVARSTSAGQLQTGSPQGTLGFLAVSMNATCSSGRWW